VSPLTLFDARNAATVRRAMQDAAQHGTPLTFGEQIALDLGITHKTPNFVGWRVSARVGDTWALIAEGLPSDDAVNFITNYARNLGD